jgi:formate dehydrogenase maturation protein FdhE
MAKKSKVKTPEWIIEGYDSPAAYNKAKGIKDEKKKGKTFKIRECPLCGSDDVGLVLTNSDEETGGGKEWECRKCKWKGNKVKEKELTEDEFMRYLDEKGEEIA